MIATHQRARVQQKQKKKVNLSRIPFLADGKTPVRLRSRSSCTPWPYTCFNHTTCRYAILGFSACMFTGVFELQYAHYLGSFRDLNVWRIGQTLAVCDLVPAVTSLFSGHLLARFHLLSMHRVFAVAGSFSALGMLMIGIPTMPIWGSAFFYVADRSVGLMIVACAIIPMMTGTAFMFPDRDSSAAVHTHNRHVRTRKRKRCCAALLHP